MNNIIRKYVLQGSSCPVAVSRILSEIWWKICYNELRLTTVHYHWDVIMWEWHTHWRYKEFSHSICCNFNYFHVNDKVKHIRRGCTVHWILSSYKYQSKYCPFCFIPLGKYSGWHKISWRLVWVLSAYSSHLSSTLWLHMQIQTHSFGIFANELNWFFSFLPKTFLMARIIHHSGLGLRQST